MTTVTSDSIDQLLPALLAAKAEFKVIPKGAKNPFYDSTYANLKSIIEGSDPILAKHDLVVMQFPSSVGDKPGLTTWLAHSSGQFIRDTATLQPAKSDPQAQGSAISYMRRYSIQAVLGLITDDDDGNAASRPAETPAKAAPAKPAKAGTPVAALKALCAKSEWPLEAVNALYLTTYKVGVAEGSAEDVKAFTALLETGAIKVSA